MGWRRIPARDVVLPSRGSVISRNFRDIALVNQRDAAAVLHGVVIGSVARDQALRAFTGNGLDAESGVSGKRTFFMRSGKMRLMVSKNSRRPRTLSLESDAGVNVFRILAETTMSNFFPSLDGEFQCR